MINSQNFSNFFLNLQISSNSLGCNAFGLTAGNCIGDEGVHNLPLSTLPNLTSLVLACNNLTHVSMKTLADLVSSNDSGEKPLQVSKTDQFAVFS